jgi:hypothetical protein
LRFLFLHLAHSENKTGEIRKLAADLAGRKLSQPNKEVNMKKDIVKWMVSVTRNKDMEKHRSKFPDRSFLLVSCGNNAQKCEV